MKHNLKQKYGWKHRKLHFARLNMAKHWHKELVRIYAQDTEYLWGMERNFTSGQQWPDKILHEPDSESGHLSGESALEGERGTTNPLTTIQVREPQRYTTTKGK